MRANVGRTLAGAAAGGIVCCMIGLYAGLGVGWLSQMDPVSVALLAAILGAVLGLAGIVAGGAAGRAGSPLPFLPEDGQPPRDGPEADYHDLPELPAPPDR